MSGLLAIGKPRRIKASRRRRRKLAVGHTRYANNNPYTFIDPDGRQAGTPYGDIMPWNDSYTSHWGSGLRDGGVLADFTPIGDLKAIAEAFANPTAANIVAAVIGLAGPLGDAAAKGVKGADAVKNAAAANRAESQAKGIPDSQIGPSGKPKIHIVDHGGKRGEAREGARRDAGKSGSTVNHTSPTEGKDHYHGVTQGGEKLRIHHEYDR